MPCGSRKDKIVSGAAGITKAALGIDRADDATIAARRDACRNCEHATRHAPYADRPSKGLTAWSRCKLCSCVIKAKTANAGEACPAGKWGQR